MKKKMNETPEAVKPKIDDQFWFNWSETLISQSEGSTEKAAAKLQNLVIWLWGIYTASATVGFTLSKQSLSFWPTLIIALASAFLIALYWSSVWVQLPIKVSFDPRSPTEIREAYAEGIRAKNLRLKITVVFSFLAAVTVSIALIVASIGKPRDIASMEVNGYIYQTGNSSVLYLTGGVGKANRVSLQIKPTSSPGKPVTPIHIVLKPDENGFIRTNIPLRQQVSRVMVTLEWENETGTHFVLSKKIEKE